MWFINTILAIWAYVPFFALTDDNAFLVAKWKSEQYHKYYFSIVNLLFGEKKVQLFSFYIGKTEKRFILFRIMSLSKMEIFTLSEEQEKEMEHAYKAHFDSLCNKDQNIEKEALLQHLSDEKARIETSYNKINAFTTIIIAVIPITIALIDINTIKGLSLIGWIFFAILIYAYINLCAWILQANSVRSFQASAFRILKKSKNKAKEYNWQIYYDWQQMKPKANMYVSFVRYIKEWVVIVIIITILFFIFIPIIEEHYIKQEERNIYTLQLQKIEIPYEKSSIYWSKILADLNSGEYKNVIVLYNNANNDMQLAMIKEKFKKYNHQKIIWIEDNTLRVNEIKIIIGE